MTNTTTHPTWADIRAAATTHAQSITLDTIELCALATLSAEGTPFTGDDLAAEALHRLVAAANLHYTESASA